MRIRYAFCVRNVKFLTKNIYQLSLSSAWIQKALKFKVKLYLICCLCLADSHELGGGSTERYPGSKGFGHPDYGNSRGSGSDPVFDNNLITDVTAQLGETAYLHCRVRNLGERPVSRG
jgi:hypothetical protein